MTSLTIRRATTGDAAAIARVFADPDTYPGTLQLPYPSEAGWRARLESQMAPGSQDQVLVAEQSGLLVGMAGLHSVAKHVHVVRREGDSLAVRAVSAETFGESIGLITAQVFGMDSNTTDFHEVLDELIAKHKSIEAIERVFLGEVMSHQARAYVITKLASGVQQ